MNCIHILDDTIFSPYFLPFFAQVSASSGPSLLQLFINISKIGLR